MRLVHGGRQTGKTIAAIREAARTNSYIVVPSHKEARRVADAAERDGVAIPFPITFDEYTEGAFNPGGVRGFVIDGAEALIQRFSRGVPVHLATFDDDTAATARGPERGK